LDKQPPFDLHAENAPFTVLDKTNVPSIERLACRKRIRAEVSCVMEVI
jgi:hypothetical protein